MTDKYWLGQADEVAQVDTVQVTAYDAATTYNITIGGVSVSAPGNTDVDTTASDLAAAFNASTHPYFAGITATPSTDTVTLTANVPGAPFVASSGVVGGTGTIGAVTSSTANEGPCSWDSAGNWSDGAVPANGDTVIFRDNDVNLCFGLDQNALALIELRVEQTYTGLIGLNRNVLVTSADGNTTDASKSEYREDYLRVDVDIIEIGKHVGGSVPAGSGRIKISNESTDAAVITVFNSANTGAEPALAPVRLKAANANTDLYIRDGRVGLGIDEPLETCDLGDIFLNGVNSRLYMGAGCSFENLTQSNGLSLVQSDATVTSIKLLNGTLRTEGDFTVTTLDVDGGTLFPNHIKTAGNAITTFNINDGVVVGNETSEPRTWAAVNMGIGANLTVDPNQVTMTALNDPGDEYTVAYS